MNNFKKLQLINPHLNIQHIKNSSFLKYGSLIENFNYSEIEKYIHQNFKISSNSIEYVPSIPYFIDSCIKHHIEATYFDSKKIQIGWCSGKNSKLNGLEYHIGNELTVALTDLLIILGEVKDILDQTYDSAKTEIFYVPKGSVYNLYPTTLHYAPCQTDENGFETIVILPEYTNTPIEKNNADTLLFMSNKWLLVHPDNSADIKAGAHIGIIGDNITLNY